MSTHAIVWFDEEDVLGKNSADTAAPEIASERRWPRIKIDVRIRVTVCVGLEVETVDGQGNDVGEGGMAAYIPAELKQDDNVVVEVVRRYGQPRLTFSAKVNNRNGFRYGLEFVGIEDDKRAAMVSAIAGNTTEQ